MKGPSDLLLAFLENVVHPGYKMVGIDMDSIQMKVYKSIPDPTFAQCMIVVVIFSFVWWGIFRGLDHVVIRPFMHTFRKTYPCLEYWHEFDEKQKVWYSSYWFAILHAVFSVVTSYYCFLYADGQPGTTWFSSKQYQLTMFPIQKYIDAMEAGYFVQDFYFCIQQAEGSGLMLQTYAHHIFGCGGQLMTLYMGGAFASICQISFITEASTPFVNGRQILAWHHLTEGKFYVFNGLMMTIVFFWIRVVYYGYMIFDRVRHWVFVEPNFMDTYYSDTLSRVFAWLSIILYSMMYILQLFWFYKIMNGLLKALGFIKSKSKKVKTEKKVD